MLNAYLDASLTNQPPRVTVVAGYVAPLDECIRLETEWKSALHYWNIERFRLSGLEHLVGKSNVGICELYFEGIIKRSQLAPIGSALLNADWDKSDWGEATVRLPTPYEQCLGFAFEVVGEFTAEYYPDESVSVFCCPDANRHKIDSIFKQRRTQYPHLASVKIDFSKHILPLQCADLGAGRLRQSWRVIASGAPEAKDLPWGALPSGRGVIRRTSIWSLRQGAVLTRALKIHERNLG